MIISLIVFVLESVAFVIICILLREGSKMDARIHLHLDFLECVEEVLLVILVGILVHEIGSENILLEILQY